MNKYDFNMTYYLAQNLCDITNQTHGKMNGPETDQTAGGFIVESWMSRVFFFFFIPATGKRTGHVWDLKWKCKWLIKWMISQIISSSPANSPWTSDELKNEIYIISQHGRQAHPVQLTTSAANIFEFAPQTHFFFFSVYLYLIMAEFHRTLINRRGQ